MDGGFERTLGRLGAAPDLLQESAERTGLVTMRQEIGQDLAIYLGQVFTNPLNFGPVQRG